MPPELIATGVSGIMRFAHLRFRLRSMLILVAVSAGAIAARREYFNRLEYSRLAEDISHFGDLVRLHDQERSICLRNQGREKYKGQKRAEHVRDLGLTMRLCGVVVVYDDWSEEATFHNRKIIRLQKLIDDINSKIKVIRLIY